MIERAERGILYIATGRQFVEEARISAQTVAEHMPDIPISLMTDQDSSFEEFDAVMQLSNPHGDFGDQVNSLERTPYDRTIFLDSDIHLTDSISDLFTILDEFDIAAAHNQQNYSSQRIDLAEIEAIPESFPEYNSGVVAFRLNDAVHNFFRDWQDVYETVRSAGQQHNQAAFRLALYRNDLRIATLPTKYNCIFRRPGTVNGQVKVFHGRLFEMATPGAGHEVDVDQAVAELNRRFDLRSYYRVGNRVRLSEPNLLERGLYSVRDRGMLETIKQVPSFVRGNRSH